MKNTYFQITEDGFTPSMPQMPPTSEDQLLKAVVSDIIKKEKQALETINKSCKD